MIGAVLVKDFCCSDLDSLVDICDNDFAGCVDAADTSSDISEELELDCCKGAGFSAGFVLMTSLSAVSELCPISSFP